MRILSLNDGAAALRVALERARIKVDKYYSCERDFNLIKCSLMNFADIIKMGDITHFEPEKDGVVDLVVGFDITRKEGRRDKTPLADSKDSDFWQMLRILKATNPKYYLFIAVSPKIDDVKTITDHLGTFAVEINSSRLSCVAQRVLYWTNISGGDTDLFNVPLLPTPEDIEIELQSVLEFGYAATKKAKPITMNDAEAIGESQFDLIKRLKSWKTAPNVIFEDKGFRVYDGVRVLTKTEIERICGYPDGYTSMLTAVQAIGAFMGTYNIPTLTYICERLKKEI